METEELKRHTLGEGFQTVIADIKFITIRKLCELTGYTSGALYAKIHRGDWVDGKEYRKAPDGRPLISVEGYNNWVTGLKEKT